LPTPIYILAGQSNARALRDPIRDALDRRHGNDAYVLIEAHAAGAPLTFRRDEADWNTGDELPLHLRLAVTDALLSAPDARVEGVIWLQGESDTYDIARAHEYATRLDALFDGLRGQVAGLFGPRDTGIDTAPVALAALSAQAGPAALRGNWDDIIAQQHAYAGGEVLAHLVDPDALAAKGGFAAARMFRDGLHYSADFGAALAEALVAALDRTEVDRGNGVISGTDLDDILAGTSRADLLAGGPGNDTYVVNHPHDRIDEQPGQGTDLVIAERSYSLRAGGEALENLTLAGDGPFRGIGNGLDNVISGNSGNNRLNGGRGDDILYGGAGDDVFADPWGANRLIGGQGNDTYRITQSGSRIVELAGEGVDRVFASINFTLRYHSQDLENLKLIGRADLNGTGNGRDNILNGNRGDNALDGAWGDDRLFGRGGDDRLRGDLGDDVLTGGRGHDSFVFRPGDGSDRITDFDPARDRLGFGGGIDIIRVEVAESGRDTLVNWGDLQILLEGIAPEMVTRDHLFAF